jgi:putative ABC transport system substrate-binding protein
MRVREPSIVMRGAALALLVFAVSAAEAQPAHRVYRIGVLNEAWAANHPTVEGLKAGLRDWGFTEGQDVAYDIRFTKGDPAATQAAAEALVKAGVDLIFTSNESAMLAAKKATDRIPVVFTLVGDPVGALVVPSLSKPGGNITGVSSRAIELAPKRLEMLKMLAPRLQRAWLIIHVTDIMSAGALDHLRQAATVLNIELLVKTVSNAQELDSALKEIKPGDGLLAPAVDTLDIPVVLLDAARKLRAPAIYPSELYVTHGAVISYGPELRAQGVQAARLVAKILRGTRPQDLPVENADTINLSVNLLTAAELELPVPQKILIRANVVRR